jgi:hypothetical protein
MWFIVALVCAMIFAGTCTKAEAAREAKKAPSGEKAKTPPAEGGDEVYKKALEDLSPLAIGWTTAARDLAFEMDDGRWDPDKLAAAAVLRASRPYREEMEAIWDKLPADGENTSEMEVDRFEQNLTAKIKDLILERRKFIREQEGKDEAPAASKKKNK